MFTLKKEKTSSTNELIRKADLQLLQLQQDIDQRLSAITQAEARIAAIEQAAHQRSLELSTIGERIQEHAGSVERTRSFADLAAGTRQEQEANAQLKTVQAQLREAQSLYDQDLERAAREQKKEEELTSAAREQITQKQQELDDLYQRLASITAAREQAITSRGRDLHQSALSALHHQQERLATLQRCMDQEQERLAQLLTDATEQLVDYPDLAREIERMYPQDDAMIRMVKAALSYIDTILTERGEMPEHLSLPSTKFVSPLMSLFTIPADELWHGINIRENPALLSNRREKLQRVLDEYWAKRLEND